MSINAAIEVVDFTPLGGEVYNDPNWENITLIVTYPAGSGQDFSSNPIEEGDIVVDRSFQVWEIVAVNSSVEAENSFNVNMTYLEGTPSGSIAPDQTTDFGLVVTPKPGGLDPYWDAQYVDTDVWKKARAFSIAQMEADIINKWQIVDNTDILAKSGTAYLVDCSTSPVTITAPSNPEIGNCFGVKDVSASASINNITLTSTDDIENSSSDYVINTNKRGIYFIYTGSTYGWVSTSETMGPAIYA